jgi:hypothetical protein
LLTAETARMPVGEPVEFAALTDYIDMSSNSQISANRANAKKSIGPRTAAGKAAVSLNAVKHGLTAQAAVLPDEDEEAFTRFANDLLAELQPIGTKECLLADQIVNLAWRLRRASLVEVGLFVRAEAIADREWAESEWDAVKVIEEHIRAFGKRPLDGPDPSVVSEADMFRYSAAVVAVQDVVERRESEVGRLGNAFAEDAVEGNAFSKLQRYETSIDKRLSQKFQEFEALQAARAS